MLALSGCSDSKQISEVKALPFELINSIDLPQDLTVDQALDNRKVCDDIKWTTDKDNQGETIVTYRCDYKGVDDSLFVKNGGLDVKSAGDVYQWTYGRDDKPALTGVAAIINQKDGKSVDIAPGQSANYTIWLAFHNTAKDFDEAYLQLSGKAVPSATGSDQVGITDSGHDLRQQVGSVLSRPTSEGRCDTRLSSERVAPNH
jgi:hypothetical protein